MISTPQSFSIYELFFGFLYIHPFFSTYIYQGCRAAGAYSSQVSQPEAGFTTDMSPDGGKAKTKSQTTIQTHIHSYEKLAFNLTHQLIQSKLARLGLF